MKSGSFIQQLTVSKLMNTSCKRLTDYCREHKGMPPAVLGVPDRCKNMARLYSKERGHEQRPTVRMK